MIYETLDDWLFEVENFSLRAERIPPEALEWVKVAWQLGFEAGKSQRDVEKLK